MSVVVVGGNDRMSTRYREICKSYKCKAKIFTQMPANFENKIDDFANKDALIFSTFAAEGQGYPSFMTCTKTDQITIIYQPKLKTYEKKDAT